MAETMTPEEKLATAVDGLLLYIRRTAITLMVVQVVMIVLILAVLWMAHRVVLRSAEILNTTTETKAAVEAKTEIEVEATDSSARLVFKRPDSSASVTVPIQVPSATGGLDHDR